MHTNMRVYKYFVCLCILMDVHDVLLSMSDEDWIMLSEVAHDNIRDEIKVIIKKPMKYMYHL